MKHHIRVTLLLVGIFFLSQVIGLFVINGYIDHGALKDTGDVSFTALPYNVERPDVDQSTSFWYIISAILLGTILLLLIIKFRKTCITFSRSP